MKLAGKVSVMLLRATVTDRSSNGWRSISSTLRANSGSSSRNRTPLCARLTSPGRGMPDPPPIRPASDTVWCGARNGLCDNSPARHGESAQNHLCRALVLGNARVAGTKATLAADLLPDVGGHAERRIARTAPLKLLLYVRADAQRPDSAQFERTACLPRAAPVPGNGIDDWRVPRIRG